MPIPIPLEEEDKEGRKKNIVHVIADIIKLLNQVESDLATLSGRVDDLEKRPAKFE